MLHYFSSTVCQKDIEEEPWPCFCFAFLETTQFACYGCRSGFRSTTNVFVCKSMTRRQTRTSSGHVTCRLSEHHARLLDRMCRRVYLQNNIHETYMFRRWKSMAEVHVTYWLRGMGINISKLLPSTNLYFFRSVPKYATLWSYVLDLPFSEKFGGYIPMFACASGEPLQTKSQHHNSLD